jgi:Protein of unknown function (DUF2846).
MKPMLSVLLVPVLLTSAIQARSTVLPDSCGDDKTHYDVKTDKKASAPAPMDDSKAIIVFVESIDKSALDFCIKCDATVRFGVDGAWAGANKGNSFFSIPVAAGEHHICANWQSRMKALSSKVGMTTIMAEAGHVYYIEAAIKSVNGKVNGTNGDVSTSTDWNFTLAQVDQDQGKYRVKLSAQAVATSIH